jgi:pilus assembly protein Flp/PilA
MLMRFWSGRIGNGRLAPFMRDRRGVTALEYGLLTGLIALVIVGGITLFSSNANTLFTHISNTL